MKTMTWISAFFLFMNFSSSFAQIAAKSTAASAEVKANTATNEVKANNPNGPVAKYDKTVYDFGNLTQNQPGTASFTLTNEGKEPLIISAARASCGCTNLTYAKDPILPGKSTSISVTYNAAALGSFSKTVTVTTNADQQSVILQIKGIVQPPKEDPKS
ncbi:MAG: DUF1573 domain-containing protein [Bacteroidota bacterium]